TDGTLRATTAVPVRLLPSLTGLRFVLALTVLACHALWDPAWFTDPGVVRSVSWLKEGAEAAVSGFFVLSGYVLTWTHRADGPARAFWRQRFWRIAPNHLLGWAGAVAFVALTSARSPVDGTQGRCTVSLATASVLLLQNWTPAWAAGACFNVPSWSISCEVFFYALFPALIIGARAIPRRWLPAAWAATAAATLAAPLTAALISPVEPDFASGLPKLWLLYFFPPVRLAEFALGMLTALLLRGERRLQVPPSRLATPLALAIASTAVLTALAPPAFRLGAQAAVPFALFIAYAALTDLDNRPTLLSGPLMTSLGEASYALYIVHWPLLLAYRHALGADRTFSASTGVLLAAGFAVLALAASLLVHHFWETPLRRRGALPTVRTGVTGACTLDSRPR
uniref:acyltransferase family protein n=1 Tax=Streptomyces flavofungini TaxID=68200 RepID=UPI0034DE05F3